MITCIQDPEADMVVVANPDKNEDVGLSGLARTYLIGRAAQQLFALPIASVAETMRALPITPLAGAPSFVRGVAVIRGGPVPILDTEVLLGGAGRDPRRFILLKTPKSNVALTADEVIGIHTISPESLESVPPILAKADPDVVDYIGTVDATLLLVLKGVILMPDALWTAVAAGEKA